MTVVSDIFKPYDQAEKSDSSINLFETADSTSVPEWASTCLAESLWENVKLNLLLYE